MHRPSLLLAFLALAAATPAAAAEFTFPLKTTDNTLRVVWAKKDDNAKVSFYEQQHDKSREALYAISRAGASGGGSALTIGSRNHTYTVKVSGFSLSTHFDLGLELVQPGGRIAGVALLTVEYSAVTSGGKPKLTLTQKSGLKVAEVAADGSLQVSK